MLWGEDGGLGEVSTRRVNMLFLQHFSGVLITALLLLEKAQQE